MAEATSGVSLGKTHLQVNPAAGQCLDGGIPEAAPHDGLADLTESGYMTNQLNSKKPKAGQISKLPSGSQTYLSPLPLATGLPPADHNQIVAEMRNDYLEVGALIFSVPYGVSLSFIGFLIVLFPRAQAYFKLRGVVPTRFNRQRREVCLVPSDSQLTFRPPAHDKTRHGIRTRDLVLMVKLETLEADGAYTGSVYMLKVTPDGQYPLTPVQKAPKAEVTWWQLRQPLIMMDSL